MEMVLTIALSGLGTAAGLLSRKSAKEKDAKRRNKLKKVAAAITAAQTAINDMLTDPAFADA